MSVPLATQLPLAGFGGPWELWIVLLIILLLFGRRLPGVARSLGQGISSFKKGLNEPVDQEEKEPAAPAKNLPDADDSAASAS